MSKIFKARTEGALCSLYRKSHFSPPPKPSPLRGGGQGGGGNLTMDLNAGRSHRPALEGLLRGAIADGKLIHPYVSLSFNLVEDGCDQLKGTGGQRIPVAVTTNDLSVAFRPSLRDSLGFSVDR